MESVSQGITIDDFYPLDVLLNSKSKRHPFGIYKTYPWRYTYSDGDFVDHQIVFDLKKLNNELNTKAESKTGLDMHKLCMSFLFWTKSPKGDLKRFIRKTLADIIGQYGPVKHNFGRTTYRDRHTFYTLYETIKKWSHQIIIAALMYLFKHSPLLYGVREYEYVILHYFMGGGGWGYRESVFGNNLNNIYDTDQNNGQSLVEAYNTCLNDVLIHLEPTISNITQIANATLYKSEAKRNLTEFLRRWMHLNDANIQCILDVMYQKSFDITLDSFFKHSKALLASNGLAQLNALMTTYNSGSALPHSEYALPENCVHCWLSDKRSNYTCGHMQSHMN